MKFDCVHVDCNNSIETGHALYRVSPKGQPFEGVCEKHAAEMRTYIDDRVRAVASVFEDDNHQETT